MITANKCVTRIGAAVTMRKARFIRQDSGRSLTDVVRATTIGLSHLSDFERGESWMSEEKLRELATLYGVTIDDLLAEVEEEVPAS